MSVFELIPDSCATKSLRPLLGSDPEILFKKPDGSIAPSFLFLEEQESGVYRVPYRDGWQGEMGTEPTSCLAWMVDDIHLGLLAAHRAATAAGVQISDRSVMDVSLDDLWRYPVHAEFGCTPSKNAYGEPPLRVSGADVPFRMAGGHIHFGWNTNSYLGEFYKARAGLCITSSHKHSASLVRLLDRTAGLIGVAMFSEVEDVRRRLLYGKAGEYRTPKHGIEYRTPSNAWLCHPAISHFYLHLARHVFWCGVEAVLSDKSPDSLVPMDDAAVRHAVNSNEAALARELLASHETDIDWLLSISGRYAIDRSVAAMFDRAVWETGVLGVLPEDYTFEKAWKLDGSSEWVRHSDGANESVSQSAAAIIRTGKLAVA